ncbi:MAG: FAD-dependent oxidoreductase [Planctomycetota bacterium]|jgi:4-methylaminobutanoate oxidase (formaldehyde-forming)|nr:FAD-dependent oxidoreductase [Planctomycetota bacterium]MDP6761835.1 FAD-dependent oxidoreductase [Planctomycetota bacterium]MDP6988881.1 FAD-dependent oxidoreductase [Planctomycetota bacterium]
MTASGSADALVIGGGILGCSIAWNLARQGAGRVVLCERGEVGAATTSRAAALVSGVRSDAAQTALALETRRAVAELREELGDDLALHEVGSLHLAASPESERTLEELSGRARKCGEPCEWLTPAEASSRAPWLRTVGVTRVAYLPRDGFIDPYLLAAAYARAARARGVEIRTGVEVLGISIEGGRIRGVTTSAGDLSVPLVFDAAGPWAGLLAAGAGEHLPMAPVRSHYWITAQHGDVPAGSPVVVLPDAAAYARPEVGRLLFGLRESTSIALDPRAVPADLADLRFESDPDGWETLEECAPAFARFFPALEHIPLEHYVSGPSSYTPDGRHVVGRLPSLDGFWVAAGCCGAGIAVSGGVGRALVLAALGLDSPFDLEPFRPDRFGSVDAFEPAWLARCAAGRSRKRSG